MKKILWYVMLLLAVSISGYSIVQYFFFGAEKAGFMEMKEDQALPSLWYVCLYVHIIGSSIALASGPFLFLEKIRIKRAWLHRRMGKFYFIGILFGGLSGLFLAFYATGGMLAKSGFGMLAIIWLLTGIRAYSLILQKKVDQHRSWMIRNYSLSLGAVTLRMWLPLFLILFGGKNFETSYAIISWLSWVPNLLIAELFINRMNRKFFPSA